MLPVQCRRLFFELVRELVERLPYLRVHRDIGKVTAYSGFL
jgi:hypothetical protein